MGRGELWGIMVDKVTPACKRDNNKKNYIDEFEITDDVDEEVII